MRARDRLRTDHAAGAGLVLHDDGYAEILGELLADDSRDQFARAARSVGHDELDRTRRIGLRGDGPDPDRSEDGEQNGQRVQRTGASCP